MNYRKMLVILMLGALTACQGPAGEAGATGPAGEIGPKGDQGVAGNDGTAGQDLAAPSAAIASVAPNALLVGRTTTVRIVGYFTEWDESTTVRLTDTEDADIEGVEVATVVVSPVGLVATVTVGTDVALGALKLHVATGDSTLQYMPEGASVTVTANATSNQSEIRAGDDFDILIETAEFMAYPTLNVENCEGTTVTQLSRYSQYKFKVTGRMHPAMSLGDCAMVLIQDPETEDEWSSAVIVTITAPDVITFNEGVVAGDNAVLTPERPFRVVAVSAAANEVVSIRHTIDDENNLDGTGPQIDVFVEGNLEPIAVHDGTNRWLEIPNVEARELLVSVRNLDLEEGDDPISFNLTKLVPNTLMTALQDGATQGQRLPANEDGANEAGRGSWYTFTNENQVFASITVAPDNADTLQSNFVVYHNDSALDSGTTSWEGVLPVGTIVVGVFDDEQAEADGILSFAVELVRSELNVTDENGAGTAAVNTGEVTNFLVDVPAGQVLQFSASTEGDAVVAVAATWVGSNTPVVRGDNLIWLPSAEDNQVLLSLSIDGDLGEGVDVTVQATLHEAAAFSLVEENAGEAIENTGAWFVGALEDDTLLTVSLTPGTAEHMQPGLTFYAANGAMLATSETASLRQLISAGAFFVHVSDREFVAEQDQTFTASALLQSPGLLVCLDAPAMSTGENGVGSFEVQGNTRGSEVSITPLYGNRSPIQVYSLTVTAATQVSINMEAAWDTKLWVVDDCNAERYGDWVAYNDDDYSGPNRYDSAVNFNMAANSTVFVIAGGYGTNSGPYTLQYSLQQ